MNRKKITSLLLITVFILSTLAIAIPIASALPLVYLESGDDGTAEWSTLYANSGVNSVELVASSWLASGEHFARIVLPMEMAFVNLEDFSFYVDAETAQKMPLHEIELKSITEAITVTSTTGGGTIPVTVDKINIAYQPEDVIPDILTDAIPGFELYGTHDGADVHIADDDEYWSIWWDEDGDGSWDGWCYHFTWTEIHSIFDGKAIIEDFRVEAGAPSTVYVDDIKINDITYDLKPNLTPVLATIGNQAVDEEVLLTFKATATDPNPADTLTFSLVNAPAGAAITEGGVFTWTPTEAQGGADYTFTVKVTDDGIPSLSDEETITVTVNKANVAPVLDPIGDKTVDELALLTFTAKATDSDTPANTLTYSLEGTVPAGADIDPVTGVFTWTPTEDQGPGDHTFTVVVTDDGIPSLFAEEEITVTVNEVNLSPVLATIGNQAVDEEVLLTFTAKATDPNPADTLTFSLVNAPAGAAITEGGVFTWTPTEAQGGADYTFTVVVTDDGIPSLFAEEEITVTVNEVNVAPVLAGIGDQVVDEEVLLTFTAKATDDDLPINTLTYSLEGTVPSEASIVPDTGVFTWTPTEAQGGADYTFTVRVTDDGDPSLSDEEEITVTVTICEIRTRSTEYVCGDTISIYGKCSDAPLGAVLDITTPDGRLFWTSNPLGPTDWENIDGWNFLVWPSSMVTPLSSDVPLGSWTFTAYADNMKDTSLDTNRFDVFDNPTLDMILERLDELDVSLSLTEDHLAVLIETGIDGIGSVIVDLEEIAGLITDAKTEIITEVDGKYALLNTELGVLKVSLVDLDAELVALEGDVAAISTTLGELQVSLEAIDAKLVTLEGTLATISTEIGTITTSVDSIGLKVTDIQDDVATIETSLGILEGLVTSIEDNIATIVTDLGTIQADVSAILNPETGTLSIDTSDVKGEVFVDGVSWGIAPKEKDVLTGTYTVTFGDMTGYTTPISQEAEVTADKTTTITGTYVKVLPVTDIDLIEGLNLISLPLIPTDPSVTVVIADIMAKVESVWSYDAATGLWASYSPGAPSDLTEMVDGKGYWVSMTASAVLAIDGTEMPVDPLDPLPAYPVVEGWNLMGFKETYSMTVGEYLAGVEYIRVYGYLDGYNVLTATDYMIPGKGYWIAASDPGTIYP